MANVDTAVTPYAVTTDNLKRGVFKDCADGRCERCAKAITHRHARPDAGIWNYLCTCECHPTAFGDDSKEYAG